MNKEIVDKIEEKTAKLLNVFRLEMEKCEDEIEYMDLVASVLLFKNLIIKNFEESLRQDIYSEEDISIIVNKMIDFSNDIFKSVAFRIDEPNKFVN